MDTVAPPVRRRRSNPLAKSPAPPDPRLQYFTAYLLFGDVRAPRNGHVPRSFTAKERKPVDKGKVMDTVVGRGKFIRARAVTGPRAPRQRYWNLPLDLARRTKGPVGSSTSRISRSCETVSWNLVSLPSAVWQTEENEWGWSLRGGSYGISDQLVIRLDRGGTSGDGRSIRCLFESTMGSSCRVLSCLESLWGSVEAW